MCCTAEPSAPEPSPKSTCSEGLDMRSVAAADMTTACPAVPAAGTSAAVIAGGTGSKPATCAEYVSGPDTCACQTANALPSSSSAMAGALKNTVAPPGGVTATGVTSRNS